MRFEISAAITYIFAIPYLDFCLQQLTLLFKVFETGTYIYIRTLPSMIKNNIILIWQILQEILHNNFLMRRVRAII